MMELADLWRSKRNLFAEIRQGLEDIRQAVLLEKTAQEMQRLRKRVAALEAALKPFAGRARGLANLDARTWIGGVPVPRWRKAARVLAGEEEGQHGGE